MFHDQAPGRVVQQHFRLFHAVVQADQNAAIGAPQDLPQRFVGMAAALHPGRGAMDIVDALDVERNVPPGLKDRERAHTFRCDAFHADRLNNHLSAFLQEIRMTAVPSIMAQYSPSGYAGIAWTRGSSAHWSSCAWSATTLAVLPITCWNHHLIVPS